MIKKDAGEPAYMQIYRQLRQDIVEGEIPNGTKLLSKRLLAEELGVSVITVQHAYELLVDEGYARSAERSGYFAAFGGTAMRVEPSKAVMSPAATGDFPFSVLARTMRRVLSERGEQILVKSPNSGCDELKSAIAAYLARSRGMSVLPEQIVVGSGAEYLYGLIVQLLGRERRFALEEPSYSKIRRVYEANGAVCCGLPLGPDGIRSPALESCDAGVLHVTPYHSYPSGVTASAAKRHEYAAWARKNDSIIVEDDYDSEFAVTTRQIDTLYALAPERVIYVNSFSKTVAPSVRTGYMLLPLPLLDRYREKLDFYSCTVPSFDQYVLAEFINNGDLERYIHRRRRAQRRE